MSKPIIQMRCLFLLFAMSVWVPSLLLGKAGMLPQKFWKECRQLRTERELALRSIRNEVARLKYQMSHSEGELEKMALFIRCYEKESEMEELEAIYDLRYAVLRYRNGIQVIKMLYEKLLDLDHHFSSLDSYREIHELTNLQSYAEFNKIKEELLASSRHKSSVELPEFLSQNLIVALGYTVVASIVGEGDRNKREDQINSIACILDFTSSMYADIKIIYYETEYLGTHNKNLLGRCEALFMDYTDVAGYHRNLASCRENDDWHVLADKIQSLESPHIKDRAGRQDGYIKRTSKDDTDRWEDLKDDLEFNIQLLVRLIEAYNNFVSNGIQYYSKFKLIVNGYQNQEVCLAHLPDKIRQLESNIDHSIKKFSTAYRLVELEGTKLKDLLYAR